MDIKKIIPIICMLSVGVMVVWGLLANDWSKSLDRRSHRRHHRCLPACLSGME